MLNSYISILSSIIWLLFILAGAYWTSRWIAGKSLQSAHGRYMKVVDRLALSHDKWIHLIQVGERVYIVGLVGQKLETIGSFPLSELSPLEEVSTEGDFPAVFTFLKGKGIQNFTALFKEEHGKTLTQLLRRGSWKTNRMVHRIRYKDLEDDQ